MKIKDVRLLPIAILLRPIHVHFLKPLQSLSYYRNKRDQVNSLLPDNQSKNGRYNRFQRDDLAANQNKMFKR